MSDSIEPTVSEKQDLKQKTYSVFLPLLLVMITLASVSCVEVVELLKQRKQLKLALAQVQEPVQKATQVNATLGKVTRELLLLSESSAEAKQIIKEFGVQVRPKAGAAPAAQ